MNYTFMVLLLIIITLPTGIWLHGTIGASNSRHSSTGNNRGLLGACSPQTIEFAWDIHDVLVKKKVSSMTLAALTHAAAPTLTALGQATKESLWAMVSSRPTPTMNFFKKIAHLAFNQGASEEFKQVLNEYDHRLWPAVVSVLTEQYPIDGMHDILQELHQHGYTSRAASNISAEELEVLSTRHPDMFCYVKPGVITHYHDEIIIKKPDARFFECYLQHYQATDKKIIFIDDRHDNVQAACQAGMIGILFTAPEQLRTDLEDLGILGDRTKKAFMVSLK